MFGKLAAPKWQQTTCPSVNKTERFLATGVDFLVVSDYLCVLFVGLPRVTCQFNRLDMGGTRTQEELSIGHCHTLEERASWDFVPRESERRRRKAAAEAESETECCLHT